MQEVEGYLTGERNYSNLKGDTGPLVYPAGFVYVFSILRWMTDDGTNILQGEQTASLKYLKLILFPLDLLRAIYLWCGVHVSPRVGSSPLLSRESNSILCISPSHPFEKSSFYLCPSPL